MLIQNYINNPNTNIKTVAVVLGITDLKNGLIHTGFYYKDKNDEVQFLHLGWDKLLYKEKPTKKYIWVDLHISDINSDLISVFCDMVFDTNENTIPYRIDAGLSFFDTDGKYQYNQFEGLTCATFVIKLLQKYAVNIIDSTQWPLYKTDKSKLLVLLDHLKSVLGSIEIYKIFYKKIEDGLVRYSPEEVVASAGKMGYPHKRDDIQDDVLILREEAVNIYQSTKI